MTYCTPQMAGVSVGDTVFKTQLPVREAQTIQNTPDKIRVRYVPTAELPLR
jgi:hypothetical protein